MTGCIRHWAGFAVWSLQVDSCTGMGCKSSKAAQTVNLVMADGSRGSISRKVNWVYRDPSTRQETQISLQQLQRMRNEFWDTRSEGSSITWQTLRAAVDCEDEELSETILSSAGITKHPGKRNVFIDERRVEYELPNFIVAAPVNLAMDGLMEYEQSSVLKSVSAEEAAAAAEEERRAKARVSMTGVTPDQGTSLDDVQLDVSPMAPPPGSQGYTVGADDTIPGLAIRFRTSVNELKKMNPSLRSNSIVPGTVLYIPGSTEQFISEEDTYHQPDTDPQTSAPAAPTGQVGAEIESNGSKGEGDAPAGPAETLTVPGVEDSPVANECGSDHMAASNMQPESEAEPASKPTVVSVDATTSQDNAVESAPPAAALPPPPPEE